MRYIKKGKRMNTKKIILLMFLAVGSGKIMASKPVVGEGLPGKSNALKQELRNSELRPTQAKVAAAKAQSDLSFQERMIRTPETTQTKRAQSLPLKSGSAENIPTWRPESETISGSRNPAIGQRSIELNVAKQNIADPSGKQQNPETATAPSKWEQTEQAASKVLTPAEYENGALKIAASLGISIPAAENLIKQHGYRTESGTAIAETPLAGNKPLETVITPLQAARNPVPSEMMNAAKASPKPIATWSNLPKRAMEMLFQKSQAIRSPQEAKAVTEQAVREVAEGNGIINGDTLNSTQKTQLQRLVSSASQTVQSGWNALQFKAWADSISSAVAKIFRTSPENVQQSNEFLEALAFLDDSL